MKYLFFLIPLGIIILIGLVYFIYLISETLNATDKSENITLDEES